MSETQQLIVSEWGKISPERQLAVRTVLDAVDRMQDIALIDPTRDRERADVVRAVGNLYATNAALWEQEDDVRRPDALDAEIVAAKRKIDRLNLQRHECTQSLDRSVLALLPMNVQSELHTETAGMIVDRLSVLKLREFHLGARGTDDGRLASTKQQLNDLRIALETLLWRCAEGAVYFRSYEANKMYGE